MPRGLYVDRPRHVILHTYEDGELQPDQVRIRTEYAAIKHGTMFHLFSGESPFQAQRFDREKRLFVEAEGDVGPGGMLHQFIGNMVVGRVEAVGGRVTSLHVGDAVYGYGPVAETVTRNALDLKPLPPELKPADAVCLDPALYAFAAVRDGRVRLGDNVVVTGLGAIGLHVVQILVRNGCLNVIAVDPIANRRSLAQGYGASLTLDPTREDVGLAVRDVLGRGADLAIESSGSYRALYSAMRAVDRSARVVTLGYYKGDHSNVPFGAEWHHNRLELISSMPVWDNPSREHPLWDLDRLERTVVELYKRGWLTSQGIVDPIVSLDQAPEAFLRIYRDPDQAVKLAVDLRS